MAPKLDKEFGRLWAATAAANLADGAVLALLPLLALLLSASPGEVAAVTVAATAAWPLLGLPGGWLVDTVDRRRLLATVNAGRALVLVGLAVGAATGSLSLSLVVTAAFLLGVGEVLADGAFTALVPDLVPAPLRGRANARVETTINVLNQLAGPPLAGLLVTVGVVVAVGSTAALYAAALVGLVLLGARTAPRPTRPRPVSGRSADGHTWRDELTAGLRLLWSDRLLRWLTVLTAAMNLVWATWGALFVVYAVNPGPLGLTPAGYGLLLAGMAIGGIAVAPGIDRAVRAVGVRRVLLLDLVGTVLLVAPAAGGLGVVPVAIGVVIAGAGSTVWRTVVATLRQNLVARDLLGRVYTASRLISWGVLPVGAALAGLLAEAAGIRVAFAGATVLAVAVLLGFIAGLRRNDLDTAYASVDSVCPAAA